MLCNALNTETAAKQVWLYFIRRTTRPRHYHESSDCFEYLKIPPLKASHPNNLLSKFSYPQKSQNRKFPTQNNPSIIPVTWNPEYPLPSRVWLSSLAVFTAYETTRVVWFSSHVNLSWIFSAFWVYSKYKVNSFYLNLPTRKYFNSTWLTLSQLLKNVSGRANNLRLMNSESL